MESALEYIARKHKTLVNDYRTPDKNYVESCTFIANEIAKLLLQEGKKPQIMFIRGKLIDTINTETLVPVQFNGKVEWGGHQVCFADGLAYDPLLDKPAPIEKYYKKAFNQELTVEVSVPFDELKKNQRKLK